MTSLALNEAFRVGPESAYLAEPVGDLTQCSDQILTKRAAAGDMQAFEEVYQRYHRRVYSLCLRMTQNVAEAEDVTQEIFIHLMRKIGSFRGESAFATWLFRITTNHVLMHFRKIKTRREQAADDGLTPVQQKVAAPAHTGHVPLLDRVALNEAVAQLPPGYRLVFILHDVMGHEHEEIAAMLGCAVGTSKSQLHKARLKLRKLLNQPAGRN